jgi:hypothetical protein
MSERLRVLLENIFTLDLLSSVWCNVYSEDYMGPDEFLEDYLRSRPLELKTDRLIELIPGIEEFSNVLIENNDRANAFLEFIGEEGSRHIGHTIANANFADLEGMLRRVESLLEHFEEGFLHDIGYIEQPKLYFSDKQISKYFRRIVGQKKYIDFLKDITPHFCPLSTTLCNFSYDDLWKISGSKVKPLLIWHDGKCQKLGPQEVYSAIARYHGFNARIFDAIEAHFTSKTEDVSWSEHIDLVKEEDKSLDVASIIRRVFERRENMRDIIAVYHKIESSFGFPRKQTKDSEFDLELENPEFFHYQEQEQKVAEELSSRVYTRFQLS